MGGGFSIFSSHLSKAGASFACPKDLCVVLYVTQSAKGRGLNGVRWQSSFSEEIAKS